MLRKRREISKEVFERCSGDQLSEEDFNTLFSKEDRMNNTLAGHHCREENGKYFVYFSYDEE